MVSVLSFGIVRVSADWCRWVALLIFFGVVILCRNEVPVFGERHALACRAFSPVCFQITLLTTVTANTNDLVTHIAGYVLTRRADALPLAISKQTE